MDTLILIHLSKSKKLPAFQPTAGIRGCNPIVGSYRSEDAISAPAPLATASSATGTLSPSAIMPGSEGPAGFFFFRGALTPFSRSNARSEFFSSLILPLASLYSLLSAASLSSNSLTFACKAATLRDWSCPISPPTSLPTTSPRLPLLRSFPMTLISFLEEKTRLLSHTLDKHQSHR